MPRRLPITKHPHPILRAKAAEVSPSEIRSAAFQRFLDDMIRTMHDEEGVGLAANQVGDPRNVAIVMTEDGPLALANLRIVSYGAKREAGTEGCLSVRGVSATVRRALTVTATALDREGRPIEFTARDFIARIVQHETDHLNGIFCIDRADRIEEAPKKP
jgi:peptide deformylase